jgi:hypothetical protein
MINWPPLAQLHPEPWVYSVLTVYELQASLLESGRSGMIKYQTLVYGSAYYRSAITAF